MSYTITLPGLSGMLVINTQDDSLRTPFPAAYRRVKEFLKKQMRAEIRAGLHPLVKSIVKDHGENSVEEILNTELRTQLLNCALGAWPFANKDMKNGPLEWWKDLQEHPNARALTMLAIKIFSIFPNSMADERTASTMTWFNSAVRNRQDVSNLINMVQIRQYYMQMLQPVVKWREIDQDLLRHRENLTIEAQANKDGDESDSESVTSELNEENLMEITDDMIPGGTDFIFEQDVDLEPLSLFDILLEKELVTIRPPTKGTVVEKPTQPQPKKND
ncbi:hypothetical protein M422DRAFT_239273 [Sphaerobolus stellatus SS14]|nr:hypothetical protein M422DRAFT_239273 [Sphaerobolus stellatus SS14]